MREICDAAGALFVLDEIQSGIGRTGAWFAFQAEGVTPDVITLAKGLGGGLPIGACIGIGAAGDGFVRGDHGSTFGGNPIACAAALAVLDVIERDGLLDQVAKVGAKLADGLGSIEHPLVTGVRGTGLWLALELAEPAAGKVEATAREAGFLVNAVQPDAVRIAPPLILTEEQADSFVDALPGILEKASQVSQATQAADGDRAIDQGRPPGHDHRDPGRARTAGAVAGRTRRPARRGRSAGHSGDPVQGPR